MTEARTRFDEGIKYAEAGDHESARLKFNQAWVLLKSPSILFNLARSEQLSNRPVESLEHFRQFAKLPTDPKVTDAQRRRAAESIAELSKKVGQIQIEAPAGARVTVDGKPLDTANAANGADPVPVLPGKHTVEAIVDGKSRSVTVECMAGAVVMAKLIEASSPAEPVTSPTPAPSPATNGSEATAAQHSAAPAKPQDERASFWTTGRAVGVGAFATGLAALGAGVVFHIGAADSEKAADEIRGRLPEPRASVCSDPAKNPDLCPALRDNVDAQMLRENFRTAFFIGGVALVIGGAALFLVSSPKGSATGSTRIVPIATARDAGLAVIGQF